MYPSILRRYLSTVIDTFAILGLLFAFSRSPLYDPDSAEPTLWPLWIIWIYEPLLTAFACTLGQLVMHIRVRSFRDQRRPSLYASFVRYVVKVLLGVISILFIPRQKHRRGLHDLAAGTIVLSGSPLKQVPSDTSMERTHGE
jgi:uncharacterized RDD family membrane protein YckC